MVSPESNTPFSHVPVMLDEIVALLRDVPAGVMIDATVGGGGHSGAVLEANPKLSVLGVDRDEAAMHAAGERLGSFGERAVLRRGTFDQMSTLVAEAFPGRPVTAILFDLGVSSHQIDDATRGFSYRRSGPLDMRMDTSADLNAADVVNEYDVADLTDTLRNGGEERFAHRIARAIVGHRPLSSTTELAEVIRNAIPAYARRRPGDPAKRSFQALRLEVNGELDVLSDALDVALGLLAPNGRCVTLAYHSGEDRMIKQRFLGASTGGCTCPQGLPCVCGATPSVRLLTRGSKAPAAAELAANSRSESARLRAVEALQGDPHEFSTIS